MAISVVIAAFVYRFRRGNDALNKWAARNNYSVVSANRAPFNGPFFWSTGKSQVVFQVIIVDNFDGKTRQGYVKLGNWFWGLNSDDVKVRWDN